MESMPAKMEAKNYEISYLKEKIQVIYSEPKCKSKFTSVVPFVCRKVFSMVCEFFYELNNLWFSLQSSLMIFNKILEGKIKDVLHFKV